MRTKASLLFNPVFIFALFVLLLNDLYLKYSYSNWFTGKLSDVAGLIVLPVFLKVMRPSFSRRSLLIVSALFFAWWKSPLSQPVIDFLNMAFNASLQRIVDYTDLVAILVLPLAVKLSPKVLPLHSLTIHCLRWSLGCVTFFSLCSTSYYRHMFQAHPDMDDVYFGETIKVKRSMEAVMQTLDTKGITYRMDSVMYYPVTNQGSLYYPVRNEMDSIVRWKPVADSTMYVKMEGRQYYLVPLYTNNGQPFRNIRFTLRTNNKRNKTWITIETFMHAELRQSELHDKRIREAYKSVFEDMFEK